MKRYDSYKDSGIEWFSEIPDHWKSIRLKNLFQESLEQNWDKKCTFYLSVLKDIGVIPYHEKGNKGNKISDDTSNYRLVKKDDIVVNSTNVCIGSVGISKYDGCLSSVMYIILRPNKLTNSEYYDYLFKIRTFQKHLRKISNGILEVREYLNKTLFKVELLPVPPLSEQQQIVSFLDTKTSLIDSLIEKTQQKIELLKEKRTSLINEVVTKGLNPNVEMKDSGVEWIGEIPSHWEKSKFKFHSEIVTGNTPSKKKEELYYTNDKDGLPWVKPTRLDQGFDFVFKSDQYLTDEGQNETRVIPKNSIMVCSIGNTLGKFGISGCEMSTNQQINSVICDENSLFHRFCLFFVSVLTEDLIKWTNFVTLPIFTKSDFEITEIIIPPLSEQHQIVEYLDEQTQLIDKTISIEENRIELLKEYRQSLISEVVTGKRKVV